MRVPFSRGTGVLTVPLQGRSANEAPAPAGACTPGR